MTAKTSYINRELSWVQFNARVLAEALNKANPLLERLKFLGIVSSNFDEFFMVRVARLRREVQGGDKMRGPSGLRPSEVLESLARQVRDTVGEQYRCLNSELLPQLAKAGLKRLKPEDYAPEQADHLSGIFAQEILPALTPLAVEPGKPLLPLTTNLHLHLAFLLEPAGKGAAKAAKLAIVQIPPGLDRFRFLPSSGSRAIYVLIEDVIISCAEELFPGYRVAAQAIFRVTRAADLGVDEERDEDFLEAMKEVLVSREHSLPVRLEINRTSKELRERIIQALDLESAAAYELNGPLDLAAFMKLCALPGFDKLCNGEWAPQPPADIPPESELWDLLKERDVLLHHPYDSFEPVIRLLNQAAEDPGVLAIKMTLYRTSGESAVIQALARAAGNGKQVTVLVELKARFDEDRNIGWARQLEEAGVIVIYGIANLKVHAKALLIVRHEAEGIVRYLHLGTGNYNEKTARLYSDIGLLSTRADLSYELALFFNAITGYSTAPSLQKLVMAPLGLRPKLIQLIERETDRCVHGDRGLIMAKMNALVDQDIIDLLYRASEAGVEIRLNVRGICCLRPGIAGLSDNITVLSIVDRYLEHARLFYFLNGGSEEVYLSSADWMTRNFDKRVELMFPVEDQAHIRRLRKALELYFSDNCNAHALQPDGNYLRLKPKQDEQPVRSQEAFHHMASTRTESRAKEQSREFVVRRKPPK